MKKRLIVVILALAALWVFFQVVPSARGGFKIDNKEIQQEFLQAIDRTIKAKGLAITVKQVFTDINTIYVNGAVKGSEKVVAMEVLNSAGRSGEQSDVLPVTELKWGMHGLWAGGKWWKPFGDKFSVRFSHGLDLSQQEFMLVLYTSMGEQVVFDIPVKPELKESVRMVPLDRKIDFDGKHLVIKKLILGLTYTSLEYQTSSNYQWRNIEFILTDLNSGKRYKSGFGSMGGGGEQYAGETYFKSVSLPEGPIRLTVRNTENNISSSIDVNLSDS